MIFDRALLRRRRRRAVRLGAETFLLARVAADLAERLSVVKRTFGTAAEISPFGTTVPDLLRTRGFAETIVSLRYASCAGGSLTVVGDEEALPFADGALDLVVSTLALQEVNDLPGTLLQIRRALRPDGLFIAALFGGETLTELRQSFTAAEAEIEGGASPHVAPFVDLRDIGALLQRANFALPVADVDRITVRYPHVFSLISDLRRMGASNVLIERRRRPMRRATLLRMAEIYAQRFGDPDGRLRATFDIVWLSGWAPHASQQQPLKPGSARMRLADALGTREIPAGDKSRT
jgi:SAM-dependent methyltransferase